MEEIWKEIPGWEGRYKVSNMGRVFSYSRQTKKNGGIVSLVHNEKGYMMFHLNAKPVHKTVKIHRVVAELFVPNPNNYPEVNHIDGDKKNNKATNLEWVTRLENMRHAQRSGLMKERDERHIERMASKRVPIIATNMETGEEIRFDSIQETMRKLKTYHIYDCINGKRKYDSGYMFRKAVK